MENLVRSDEELDRLRQIYFTNSIRKGYRSFSGYTMPEKFANIQKDIEEFEVFDDDVWIISFPKSGSTWTQEMVWCICNNLNFELAREQKLSDRFSFLELSHVMDFDVELDIPQLFDSVNFIKSVARPRFIKTHLPWELLPRQIRNFEKTPKIVFVLRNPKDVCVSYFHHSKFLDRFRGDFELFWQLFITGKLPWCPFMSTILSYWNRRSKPNILLLKYEDMQRDLKSVILKVAKFFAVSVSDKQVVQLSQHLSFDEMRKNPAVNLAETSKFLVESGHSCDPDGKFFRKGKVGSYKVEMEDRVIAVFDKWTQESLQTTGLSF